MSPFVNEPRWSRLRHSLQLVLDQLAISLSAFCALHCLLVPVLLILLPTVAATPLADETFHRVLIWLVVPASTAALVLGCQRHKDRLVLLAGVVGVSGMLVAAFFGHDWFGESGERFATLLMACVLASGHLRNYRLCRKESCEHADSK